MNAGSITALIVAITALVSAVGGLGLHFNLRARVNKALPKSVPPPP
jgi:hypothetical protein